MSKTAGKHGKILFQLFWNKLEQNWNRPRNPWRTSSSPADASEERATSLVSMTKSDKERLTAIAKAHGLSLSAFFRLAADEYIANHDW